MNKELVSFKVEKVPHKLDILNYKGDAGVSILRTDTNEIISNMSSNYQLVLHEDVLSAVESVLDMNKISFSLKDIYLFGTKNTSMRARYILPDYMTINAPGGALYPMVDVNNSYDGLSKFHCAYGIWRQICSNGAMGLDGTKYDKIHIRENIELDGLFMSLDKWINNKLPLISKNIDFLSTKKPINIKYYENFLRPNEIIDFITSGIEGRNYETIGETAWAQMNALTEFARSLVNNDRRLFIEEKAMRFIYEHVN